MSELSGLSGSERYEVREDEAGREAALTDGAQALSERAWDTSQRAAAQGAAWFRVYETIARTFY